MNWKRKRMEAILLAEKSGNNEEIQKAIITLLNKEPANQFGIQRLISLRIKEGDTSSAIKLLFKYNEMFIEAQAHVQLAQLLCNTERYDEASEELDEALLLEPTNFYLWQFAGEVALKLNDMTKAKKLFLTSSKLSDYKYLRALMSALYTINLSKEKGEKVDAICSQFQIFIDKLQADVAGIKEELIASY
ncbi:hypothetical protein EIN_376130 [Entamoeba invadens IP1]|uniref:ER membrane protein complex subunit 2 n=1 Tax=Entamoeba invadens IP1 TaxID=370355 RepID=A0A0A1TW10_ENTIV|nr:hypothetical protein EIN_376130 [Entamoeba invadens IP1]ELP83468.1 hypothetical protein EIN_376130 [Entamoeba invadens IP1]|eukprot:XP_004182814.1 hypothetical protein EIN_376130 [Entamoeba invadens IP1]